MDTELRPFRPPSYMVQSAVMSVVEMMAKQSHTRDIRFIEQQAVLILKLRIAKKMRRILNAFLAYLHALAAGEFQSELMALKELLAAYARLSEFNNAVVSQLRL